MNRTVSDVMTTPVLRVQPDTSFKRTVQVLQDYSCPQGGVPAGRAGASALVLRRDGRFGAAWPVVSFWLGLAALVSGPLIAAELVGGVDGLVQRAAMWGPWAG